jgi:WD40 repeat protein
MRHGDRVASATFSSDGAQIVTASDDDTARLWDAATAVAISAAILHKTTVNSAAFSPDGTRVVTASADGTARIWDISRLEKGNAFEIACQRLGNNTDLTDVIAKFGLGELKPICGKNAPILPDMRDLK